MARAGLRPLSPDDASVGLGDRWAFHALHADGRCYGMSEGQLNDCTGRPR